MIKRLALLSLMAIGLSATAAAEADAGVFVRRVAPVRRVAARAVLPPYPVARRVAYGPVYRPVVRPYYAPRYYGPGVSVRVGW
ncbi:MAG: hypothetical protein RH917_05135 [Lacipirellulaceae bacterium]